ncbi:MAG TPA: DNA internalization-related competence protein ComEC/Rec2 [Polyangia bacterium]|nr:DNA internalization-related competence protein ComEC/Rec2 [Polyangia bacterium]
MGLGARPALTTIAGAAAVVTLTGLALTGLATGLRAVPPVTRTRLRRAPGRLAVTALVVLFGAVRGGLSARPPPLDPAVAAATAGDEPVAVVGTVARGPEPTGGGWRLVVRISEVHGRPAAGTLAVSIAAGDPDFAPGEVVAFGARLRALRGTKNPGVPDPVLALRAAGIDALATVPTAGGVRRLAAPGGWGPRRLAYVAHRRLRAAIERALGGPPAAFLDTAVLGERRGVSDTVEDGFRAAGATHVLSVSGLHLAAVAALLFVVVRGAAARVPRLPLLVDPRAVAAAVSLPAIGLFTLMTGEAVATERSALMLGLGMAALLVGRRARPAPTIAGAALILLVAQPLQLFDVSFQLSVASVAGIALCARGRRARVNGIARRCLAWLAAFGEATLAATAATAPLVAHWFGEVTPLAPIGNLALVPLVELAVVPVGLAGATAGALWAPAGRWPLCLAGAAARLALAIAELFRAHAPVWLCRSPNGVETTCATAAGLLAVLALLSQRAGARPRRALGAAAVGCALAAAGSLVVRDQVRRHRDALVVTFLDVGQGDAAVIEVPGGGAMLIDGGGSRDGSFDTGARIVEPFLRARGIARLQIVALSHPHPDHLNGLFRILQRFPVDLFWSSGDDGHNPEYRRLVDLAHAKGILTPAVTARTVGGARVQPLAPFVGGAIAAPAGLTVNDASLVLRIAVGAHAVLFPGDLEADGEGELAGRPALGDVVTADVLKVPHHGSRTSSSDELLDAVSPRLAVMSLGWRNQFHFPAPEVLARYAARGIRTLRTDRDGAVTVAIGADGRLDVQCARGCPQRGREGAEDSP